MVLRGDAALGLNIVFRQASRIDADRALRRLLTADESWIKPDTVAFAYDPQTMEARSTLEGTGTPPFTSAGEGVDSPRDWLVEESGLGSEADLTRTSDYHRDAPFSIAYPMYARAIVQVELPDGGKAFETFNGETVNRTVAGVSYSRTAAITGGRFILVSSTHAHAASFPASEAASAQAGLRSLADYQVSIRYSPPTSTAKAAASAVSAKAPAGTPQTRETPAAEAEEAFLAKRYAEAEGWLHHRPRRPSQRQALLRSRRRARWPGRVRPGPG